MESPKLPIFLGDWHDMTTEGVLDAFEATESDREGVELLLVACEYQDYDASAFVLFRKDGVLYEVNGSHCSCFGFEGQWRPEETSVVHVRMRQSMESDELQVALDMVEDAMSELGVVNVVH